MSFATVICSGQCRAALSKAYVRHMSVRPQETQLPSRIKKTTIASLHALRASKTPITMLTAYDYPTALGCSQSGLIDITLVGDSLAQVCLGYSSTTQLTLDEMIHHASAVSRGTTTPLLIADMPFGSYVASIDTAIENAVKLVKEANIDGVKLEGGKELVPLIKRLTSVGVPVMGHVGLLPQRHIALSGYKVQARDALGAKQIFEDAIEVQNAGAFSIVVEAVPKEVGKYITDRLTVPTIGIGAGPWTSGQVLVWDDIMSTYSGHKAKFVRRFADAKTVRDSGVRSYADAVRSGDFPDKDSESYVMEKGEWEKWTAMQDA